MENLPTIWIPRAPRPPSIPPPSSLGRNHNSSLAPPTYYQLNMTVSTSLESCTSTDTNSINKQIITFFNLLLACSLMLSGLEIWKQWIWISTIFRNLYSAFCIFLFLQLQKLKEIGILQKKFPMHCAEGVEDNSCRIKQVPYFTKCSQDLYSRGSFVLT